MAERATEIRELLHLSPDALRARAAQRLIICETLDALHQHMAQAIADEIRTNNAAGQPTRLILPVGPTGHYPALALMLAAQDISLAQCWFFFMDEYAGPDGAALPDTHPLSFKKIARELFLDAIPASCGLLPERVIFPDEDNIADLPAIIAEAGGIDTCYGGIGIHGHVAFNEPVAGVRDLPARKVRLNDYTVTINALRAGVGGNVHNFPRYAYTLGMREILSARRIRLYCRNGSPYDWANTILRVALFAQPGDDFPVTHIRDCDYVIITDRVTLQTPAIIL